TTRSAQRPARRGGVDGGAPRRRATLRDMPRGATGVPGSATRGPRAVTVPTQRGARRPVGPAGPPRGPHARPSAAHRRPTPARRQAAVLACVLVALAVLTGRLVYLQVLAGPQIAAAAHAARLTSVEIPADRGAILDTDGVALAESVERWDVVANPLQIAQS